MIARLEQIGYSLLATLRDQDATMVTKRMSEMMSSTYWLNSPQTRLSIQAVIDLAKRGKAS